MHEQTQRGQELLEKAYRNMGKISVKFRFLHIFIKNGEKIELNCQPQSKLLQVKHQIDALTGKKFVFFLRESFMPSLDSKVGDLAFCYGRSELIAGQKAYELILTASEDTKEYG